MNTMMLAKLSNHFLSNRLFTRRRSYRTIKLSVLSMCMLCANQSMANITSAQHAITSAKQKDLANHLTWRRLLHYPDNSNTSRVMAVEHDYFFVNPQGQGDLQGEMVSMLSALFKDAEQGDDSVQCRFPARTHWLTQQLNLALTPAHCAKYDAWQRQLQPKAMVVMFAQEFPDSMTSAFAHTLLRIDTDTNPASNQYQNSYAINYTVDGNDSDSMPVYAVKSMFGGYGGMMTIEPYVPKLNTYLKKDQRDVWTYPLKLSLLQQQQMVRHIWESKTLGLPYYFLTDNCASEVLRLIDVVRPEGQLYNEVSKMAIPSEVVRLLDEENLLNEGRYLPADKSIEQAKLNHQQVTATKRNNAFEQSVANNSPVDAYHLQRTSIGVGKLGNELGDEQNYLELGARASYHDLLDPTAGYRQNHEMDGLAIKMRVYEDSGDVDNVQLQELTLLRGRSYHPLNTARTGSSWGLHAGLTQVQDGSVNYQQTMGKQATNAQGLSQQHLVGSIGYEKGVSLAFGQPNSQYELPPQLCYGFAGGTGQLGRGITNGFRLGISANIGCVYRFNDKLRAKADVLVPYWYHGDTDLDNHTSGYWQPTASLGMQYDVVDNHALRLTFEHQFNQRIADDNDLQLSWQWYF